MPAVECVAARAPALKRSANEYRSAVGMRSGNPLRGKPLRRGAAWGGRFMTLQFGCESPLLRAADSRAPENSSASACHARSARFQDETVLLRWDTCGAAS